MLRYVFFCRGGGGEDGGWAAMCIRGSMHAVLDTVLGFTNAEHAQHSSLAQNYIRCTLLCPLIFEIKWSFDTKSCVSR